MFKDGLHLVENAELIEIEVNSIQSTYKFPQNNENIERGKCELIIFFSFNEVNRSPRNRTTVSQFVLFNSFLNLFDNDRNVFYSVPVTFVWNNFFSPRIQYYLNNFNINFSKSSIYVNQNGQTGLSVGESFLILFIYSEKKEKCSC